MTVLAGSGRNLPDVVLTDPVTGNPYDASGLFPNNSVPLNGSSGNVANAAATVTLAAAAGKTNYLAGFQLNFSGATAASVVLLTVTGLLGGTLTYAVPVPAGVTVGGQPVQASFYPPLPAIAPNTAIVVSCAALGAGNTNATLNVQGFQK